MIAILAETLKMAPASAERTYAQLMDEGFGFKPDARFDLQGFRNMLALRAEIQRKRADQVADPGRYIDLSFYDRAMGRLH